MLLSCECFVWQMVYVLSSSLDDHLAQISHINIFLTIHTRHISQQHLGCPIFRRSTNLSQSFNRFRVTSIFQSQKNAEVCAVQYRSFSLLTMSWRRYLLGLSHCHSLSESVKQHYICRHYEQIDSRDLPLEWLTQLFQRWSATALTWRRYASTVLHRSSLLDIYVTVRLNGSSRTQRHPYASTSVVMTVLLS